MGSSALFSYKGIEKPKKLVRIQRVKVSNRVSITRSFRFIYVSIDLEFFCDNSVLGSVLLIFIFGATSGEMDRDVCSEKNKGK